MAACGRRARRRARPRRLIQPASGYGSCCKHRTFFNARSSTTPVDRPEAALNVLRDSRVKMAVYSGQLLNVAARAVRDALVQLKQTGQMSGLGDRTLPRDEFNAITGVAQAVDVARRFNATRDPTK